MGKSGSVSCGVTAPFFCILVHTRFCLCPPRVFSPVLCQFWQLCGGINGDHSKRVYAMPKSIVPRAPAPAAVHCWPVPPQETLKHSFVSVSVGSLGPGAWALWATLVGMGFDSKHDFAPPTSCWGFSFALGCGVSPQSRSSTVQAPLQHLPSCWGFSVLGHGVSPHSRSSATVSWNLTIIAY